MVQPLQRVLVANRGEIACRIVETCRAMGLTSIAVYSEADAHARHVALADVAAPIGPAPATQSYLNQDTILEAARAHGADAVHPGYGFLAENAGFARAVWQAGLIWVGPHPDTVEKMGLKERARELARAAGVPLLPASEAVTDTDLSSLANAGAAIGYPLLVKASAGGGGIGIQRVEHSDDLAKTAEQTASMARRTFGDGTIYLERLVPHARHIEVQVFGDGAGGVVHLGERECSVQRRFQKVVEESPAPGLPDDVRTKMCSAAAALARHVAYAGAGTVEFVVDAATQEFFFLEMNTRIQVEHPVTEMRSGLDLVELQLRQARGDGDVLRAADVPLTGAAIECRIYAEKPEKRFIPSTGTLEIFQLPAKAAGLRVDTGLRAGDVVTRHYDPMIAKLIVYGDTRSEALAHMSESLRRVEIAGVATNCGMLERLLAHPPFVAGELATDFLDQHRQPLTDPQAMA